MYLESFKHLEVKLLKYYFLGFVVKNISFSSVNRNEIFGQRVISLLGLC